TNNFPEFTGRLCPAPCESACVLAINQDAVAIEQMEKEIIERAFAEGWVKPRPPSERTGKTAAVVGSGPAGLAAAAQLNRAGHTVTVYERADRVGGLLRYGIPDFKMEKSVIDRRLAVLEAEGVRFKTGVDVGGAVSFHSLRESHDALVLAMGARRARELEVPGRELSGVVQAMDFLEAQNRAFGGGASTLHAAGKRVVILGGGDTGSDCLGTAIRQGAKSVAQIELLPAPPEMRTLDNPWPQWPMVFRTSSSQEEGGVRQFGLRTERLSGVEGRLAALHTRRIEMTQGADGRLHLADVPESDVTLEVDLLILAMGFVGPDTQGLEELGVMLDGRGNVAVDRKFATSADGIFGAGDSSRGASLIVWAISDGREAARSVDAYLRGGSSVLPTRGAHLPFGGR
ncbi:MAG TPA: glutamate synthase subunit beta, partial [Myxococcaceae bacterium]|nr:glutamate synthase subunit beta [Myxococcaceae bacterium]